MKIENNSRDLSAQLQSWRKQGYNVALVPTMGALHDGHLSLIKRAAEQSDKVVVSIFINPTQFGENEDYSVYPRQEKRDIELLQQSAAVSLLYLPSVSEIYPAGFKTSVRVKDLSDILCGRFRPGHFDGVATIVTKLLLQVMPDKAFFGEKDYQQLLVIRRLVSDLNIPVRIESAPTIREADGLAMSSRNSFLSAKARKIAPALFATLNVAAQKLLNGEVAAENISKWGVDKLLQSGFDNVDYFELRDENTLATISSSSSFTDTSPRLFAAAYLGSTRLIDNLRLT